jgi:hypothetical protein
MTPLPEWVVAHVPHTSRAVPADVWVFHLILAADSDGKRPPIDSGL